LKDFQTNERLKKNIPPNTAFNKYSCAYPCLPCGDTEHRKAGGTGILKDSFINPKSITYQLILDWLPSYELILDGLSTVIIP